MQCVALWNWLFFTQQILLQSIQVACIYSLFLSLLSTVFFLVWTCQSLFTHLPVEGHLGCSQFLTITDKAAVTTAMNTGFRVHISFYFSGLNAQECNCWVIWKLHIFFYKRLPDCFPERLYYFIFLATMPERCKFSLFSPTFGVVAIFLF